MTWADGVPCDRHEISWCGDCRPQSPDGWWAAKYEGMCGHPTCLSLILVGEPVKWNAEGTATVHRRH